MTEEIKKKVSKLTSNENELEARQGVLKKILYGRFGQSINLEDH
jgi:chaperonin cofactor prefoldin